MGKDGFGRTHSEENLVIFMLMNCYPKSLVQRGASWDKTTTTLEYAVLYLLYQTAGFKLTGLFSSAALCCLTEDCLNLAVCFGQKSLSKGDIPIATQFSAVDINALSSQVQRYLDRCVCLSYFSWRGLMQCVLSFSDHMNLYYIFVYLYRIIYLDFSGNLGTSHSATKIYIKVIKQFPLLFRNSKKKKEERKSSCA